MENNTSILKQEIINTLPYFSGGGELTHHRMFGFGFVALTEGVRYIREKCGAYWLVDLILSHQQSVKLQGEDFQEWKLSKTSNGKWTIICTDGNDNVLASQDLNYSDFPLDGMIIWCVDNILLLPSEY